jgi:uncharacterized membrane protein
MIIIGHALHVLAAVIWVGGMFFAHLVLRPSLQALEPSSRLPVWQGVFTRFFPWVWLSVIALFGSGVGMVSLEFGGFSTLNGYVQVMMALGVLMTLIYVYLYFVPWRHFRAATTTSDWPLAGAQLRQIRLLVTTNLVLGLITVMIGASGRFT